MSRAVVLIVLLILVAGTQLASAQELKELGEVKIVVEPLDPDARAARLTKSNLESQTLVALKRDIPRLTVRGGAFPYIYINLVVIRQKLVSGREMAYFACLSVFLMRPVDILPDSIIDGDPVHSTLASVWSKGKVLSAAKEDMAQFVRESLDELLTEFAADYYRDNP